MLAAPPKLHGTAFWIAFFPSAIGVVAFWATLALNIPDYSRYAVSQRAQLRGQLVMPVVMALFAFVAIAVTSATVVVYGKPLWNPVDLLLRFPTAVVLIGGVLVILSSITINVGANVMAPARAFENLWPNKITFAIGAIMTGVLALAMQPWFVLERFGNYIFLWLGTYGTLLGPFDGIAICDYWLVRELRLDLFQLYSRNGRYDYAGGWNVRAVAALVVGWIPPLIGLWFAPLHFLWSGGWFFSIIVAGLAYTAFMRTRTSTPPHADHRGRVADVTADQRPCSAACTVASSDPAASQRTSDSATATRVARRMQIASVPPSSAVASSGQPLERVRRVHGGYDADVTARSSRDGVAARRSCRPVPGNDVATACPSTARCAAIGSTGAPPARPERRVRLRSRSPTAASIVATASSSCSSVIVSGGAMCSTL